MTNLLPSVLSFVIRAFHGKYLGVGNYIRIQNGLLRWHPGLRRLGSYCTYSRFLLFVETCYAELPPNFFHPTEAKCPLVSGHYLNGVTTNIYSFLANNTITMFKLSDLSQDVQGDISPLRKPDLHCTPSGSTTLR